jgi:3-oxoacyl-[acyl-carrier-protein] synthase II
MEKIVITGMGTINALGLSVAESWQAAVNGVSGVGPITQFDTGEYLVKIACEARNFVPENYMDGKEARRRDRFEQFAAASVKEALAQSGLTVIEANAGRIGVVISAAIGGLKSLEEAIFTVRDSGPRRVSPFLIPMLMPNGASGQTAIDYGIKGPCISVASACASGALRARRKLPSAARAWLPSTASAPCRVAMLITR